MILIVIQLPGLKKIKGGWGWGRALLATAERD